MIVCETIDIDRPINCPHHGVNDNRLCPGCRFEHACQAAAIHPPLEWTCIRCGKEILEGLQYCWNCGDRRIP